MRIVEVREVTLPIASSIANAYIDFSKMTCSLVAVVTDVIREGRPVIGYGFNSNGRYGQGGLIRERFAPARPRSRFQSFSSESEDNLDPDRIWRVLMRNEKPGGHGERSVAVGTIDMAVWDAVAKIAGKPLFRCSPSATAASRSPCLCLCGGRILLPRQASRFPGSEMRNYLDRGYSVVKMKIGGANLAEDLQRVEAVLGDLATGAQLAVDANGRFDLETAIAYARMLPEYHLFWYEEAGDPLDYSLQAELRKFYARPDGHRRKPFLACKTRVTFIRYGGMRPDRDWLQFDCALSYGLVEYLRTLEMMRELAGLPALHSPWRPSDVAQYSRGAWPWRK